MASSIDYSLAAPAQVARDLGRRLEALRLARNQRRVDLASAAGVSLRTLARLETTGRATVETLVRVMAALGLSDHLQGLLPDATLRPIDRIDRGGKPRQRARPKQASGKRSPHTNAGWKWGDES
jgi:transcriptional regulator with XRE-family HTH domain